MTRRQSRSRVRGSYSAHPPTPGMEPSNSSGGGGGGGGAGGGEGSSNAVISEYENRLQELSARLDTALTRVDEVRGWIGFRV